MTFRCTLTDALLGCRLREAMDADDLNLAWWEERAHLHGQDGFYYDTEGFLAGAPAISDRELAEIETAVGTLEGIELLHIQCHTGLGTLSLARLGARVTGLDFSETAIDKARRLAERSGIDATFIVADAQALPPGLEGRFDCAFASYGVLMWIRDLKAWMDSAARALRPGGHLVLVEGHPISLLVGSVDPPRLDGPYLGGEPLQREWRGDYAEMAAETTNDAAVHYHHGLGEVVSAAAAVGFHIEALTEWLDEEQEVPGGKLQRLDDGQARLRFAGGDLPLTYALRARKE